MSVTTEGHESVTRIVVKDDVMVQGMPVWKIDNAVMIENSRIVFYVKEFGCYFDIAVKQGKGQGAHYVREWEKLPNNLAKILSWWMDHDKEFIEDYHIAEKLLDEYKETNKISSGNWAARMSELRGLGLLFPNPGAKDQFKLDYTRTRTLLSNGGKLK